MKIDNLQIQSQMLAHMAFTHAHIQQTKFTIIAPDNLVNGRDFYSETVTKKIGGYYGKFGKSETIYFFKDTPKGKEFKSVKDILASINIEIS